VGTTHAVLGDGQGLFLPVDPRTWADQSGATRGDPLRAKWLTRDVGGAVRWHRARPLFQAIRTTVLSVPTGTMTGVAVDAEFYDSHGGHLDDVNTGRWYSPDGTGPATDWWLFNGHLPFAASAGGVRIAALRLNGAGTIHEGMKVTATAAHPVAVQVIDLLEMTANGSSYAELMAYQTTAAALNTVAAGKSPSLTVRWACVGTGTGTVSPLPAAPRTWTSADVASGTDVTGGKIPLNTHLRDVVRFLNYPPIARITSQGTTQTIPTGGGATWTSIQMPAETIDNYNGHDNVTNNTRYTCQRAGLYYIAGLVATTETAANVGYRAVRLLHTIAAGGTAIYAGTSSIPVSNATTGTSLYATGFIRMAVGDYVEVQQQHTQGAALTVNSAAGNCSRLIAVWRRL
jgi:hypothetical protein